MVNNLPVESLLEFFELASFKELKLIFLIQWILSEKDYKLRQFEIQFIRSERLFFASIDFNFKKNIVLIESVLQEREGEVELWITLKTEILF